MLFNRRVCVCTCVCVCVCVCTHARAQVDGRDGVDKKGAIIIL